MRTTSTQISAFFHKQEYPLVRTRSCLEGKIRDLLGSNQRWTSKYYATAKALLDLPALNFWNEFLTLHPALGRMPVKIDRPVDHPVLTHGPGTYYRLDRYLGGLHAELDWQFYLKEAHRIARKTGNTGLMRDWTGKTFWG